MFQCGKIVTKKHLLVEGPESNEPFEVPVPFFLVEHPQGNILFDTGQPLSAVDSRANGNYIPVMKEADHVSKQLEKAGLKTGDITHIVLSHLHSDHAGGLEAFKDTVCYIQKDELRYGGNYDIIGKYPLNWHILNGDHDIFGDGKMQIIFIPGHSPGLQALLFRLKSWGTVILASDGVYTGEILEENVLPGIYYDRADTVRTIEKIRKLCRNGVRVITGHDPRSWAGFSLAPAYYE